MHRTDATRRAIPAKSETVNTLTVRASPARTKLALSPLSVRRTVTTREQRRATMTTATDTSRFDELDYRENDGIQVRCSGAGTTRGSPSSSSTARRTRRSSCPSARKRLRTFSTIPTRMPPHGWPRRISAQISRCWRGRPESAGSPSELPFVQNEGLAPAQLNRARPLLLP